MTTATDVGFVEMRVGKVVGLTAADGQTFEYVAVLDAVSGIATFPSRSGSLRCST